MRILATAFVFFTFITLALATEAIQPPPELGSERQYVSNTETIVLNTSVENTLAFWRDNPITDFVEPTDRIPAIQEFITLKGTWGEPGSVRRVTFEGGGTVLERVLTNNDREFTYQIWNIETPSGGLVDHIYGKFEFKPVSGGTEIVWDYNVKPASIFTRPFVFIFIRNDFAPFMQSGMQGLLNAFNSTRLN